MDFNEILYLLFIAVISVIFLFVLAKLLGKRQVAQLEFMDYVIGISLGSIAAEMATDVGEKPWYYYLVAMAIYFLFDLLINFLSRKAPFLKRFLQGKPLTIIYNGELVYKNLKKSKLSINDVLSLARAQGYFNILDIEFAVLENNGNLSIMPVAEKQPACAKDLGVKLQKPELPCYLIVDGVVSYSSLNELNKSAEWLLKKIKVNSKQELKNIILAVYNSTNKTIDVSYKD